LLLLVPALASAYDPAVHQKLTFHAAKLFNSCVEETGLERLTPLQVRYIAKANVALADSNFFVRLFRWNYYDRGGQQPRSLLWIISTRIHAQFDGLVEALQTAEDDAARYRELGRIVSYLQVMTSPARVVPVYTGRFWRWSFSDRFDTYRLNDEALEARLEDDCTDLITAPVSYQSLLVETADRTLDAVRAPIDGLPATWEAFWSISDDPDGFGEYGPAGNNFGRKTTFSCSGADDAADASSQRVRRCVLLDRDPIYAAFALERHAAAVRSTARAMVMLERQRESASAPRDRTMPEQDAEAEPLLPLESSPRPDQPGG
jgi:hypothetical protein